MAQYKIIGNFGSSFSNSDKITLTVDTGTISPTTVTKAELEAGITVTMDAGATIIATAANGVCYSVAANLTTTPATAPEPTEDPYVPPSNPTNPPGFNGWKFIAGKSDSFLFPFTGFRRSALYLDPSPYGIGFGVAPTTTQISLPGSNSYVYGDYNSVLERGYAIQGYGSVSNLALAWFTSADYGNGTESVPCYNFTVSSGDSVTSVIIPEEDIVFSAPPANSILLYWYDYLGDRTSYYYQGGKIYESSTQVDESSTATSTDDNSTGGASCASGIDWYNTSQASGANNNIFYGANFPFTDSLGNVVNNAFVKVNDGVPYPIEFAICYESDTSYTYIDCAGSEVTDTLAENTNVNICAQSIISTGSSITTQNTNVSCSDDTGANTELEITIALINSSGTGNPGSGSIGGNIVGDNGTSGTWSATYSVEYSFVDNNGDGATLQPISSGPVTLSGISLQNGVTYTLTVE